VTRRLPDWLDSANENFQSAYPGFSGRRQPVHTVYGGAHLFKADTCAKLGKIARNAFKEYAPDASVLAHVLHLDSKIADVVYKRVAHKLETEAIEDYRVDFEDGFGYRSDKEEDEAAVACADATAAAINDGLLPPFFGIRIKALSQACADRSVRTLDLFLKTLGKTPENFVVTLPKVTIPEQVRALVELLDGYGGMRIELMIETPQALRDIPALIDAGDSSCSSLHFGPYDYTASLGITGQSQHLLHPACDFARSAMQVETAGLDVTLSDGPTNILPLAIHKGQNLIQEQKDANVQSIHSAWRLHYKHVRHALTCGYYQGWDLHPAQLPIRYAAVYAFFLEGLDSAALRLRNFIGETAQATTSGAVFDDAATGQGLLNHFLRAVYSGAVAEDDVPKLTSLTVDEIRLGSFARIMDQRLRIEKT
jgi:citrate lyase beta subunit